MNILPHVESEYEKNLLEQLLMFVFGEWNWGRDLEKQGPAFCYYCFCLLATYDSYYFFTYLA